uniref:Solute carrier family 26 member 11 n=1 Tax=Astyanax mexicanus TaxID=7994 RepID=A0A8B9JQF2_ASTMX
MEPLSTDPAVEHRSLRDRLLPRCSTGTVRSCFPLLAWLPRYNLAWFKMDLLAGLTVGLTVVPQGLAYAEVAGLPVQVIYSSVHYFLRETSNKTTMFILLIISTLCSEKAYYYILSVCMCFLLDFVSYPVIKGFTCAAAVTIGFGQVKNILGLKGIPQQFILQVYYTFYRIPEARAGDVILGLLCLIFLVMMTMMKSTLGSIEENPSLLVRVSRGIVWSFATVRNALVVIAAACVAYSSELAGSHFFTLTGKTAQGLPPLSPPAFSETTQNGTTISFSEIILDLGGGLAVIPLMGVLESIAIAKAFSSQNNYRINANQELFAIGLTNILGSFVSAYPVTGSFGRTAVNSQTGVCTPAGGIFTGVVVLLSLAFLMPLFYYIPKASLAAVIICAVAPMIDYKVLPQIWRVRKLDLLPFLVTFLVSFWEVQYGIVGGVIVSGMMLLYLVARPELKVRYGNSFLIILKEFLEVLNNISPARCVVLDCHHVSSIDYTVVTELKDLLKQFKLHSVSLVFTGLKPSVLEVLLAADLPDFTHRDSVEAGLQTASSNPHRD